MNDQASTSTRPYLIRALHEWCTDNGVTPYLAVKVNRSVQVPREFVQDGEIVLNVSYDATSGMRLGNDFIEFKARFGGKTREIMVPVERVQAIYSRESGQGMSFPVEDEVLTEVDDAMEDSAQPAEAVLAEDDVVARDRVVQLVPTSAADAAGSTGDNPRQPPPSAGGRPALKRIK